MAYDKQKVIDIALAEVGYLEKATYDQLDDKTANAGKKNYTKYARDLAKFPFFNGSKKGVAWCAVYVCWCFVEAFGEDAARKLLCQPASAKSNYAAGCRYARNYFKAKGQLHDTPQPGDQIFFYSKDKKSISHTGLVYKVDGSKVYTVEGNTSGASGVIANGGGVCKKSYSLTYSRLAGFGRPAYGEKTAEVPPAAPAEKVDQEPAQSSGGATAGQGGGKIVTIELNTLRNGSNGAQVRTLQRLLNARGYSCGSVDGDFGANTENAVKKFQKAKGLTADGIVGKDTWTALLTA